MGYWVYRLAAAAAILSRRQTEVNSYHTPHPIWGSTLHGSRALQVHDGGGAGERLMAPRLDWRARHDTLGGVEANVRMEKVGGCRASRPGRQGLRSRSGGGGGGGEPAACGAAIKLKPMNGSRRTEIAGSPRGNAGFRADRSQTRKSPRMPEVFRT
jgi:hypothetical protein